MVTVGEYKTKTEKYALILSHSKKCTELILSMNNTVYSAYKRVADEEFSYANNKAKEIYKYIKNGLNGCKSKNAVPMPFVMGTCSRHTFRRTKVDYVIEKFNDELCGADIRGDEFYMYLLYSEKNLVPKGIPYIKLAKAKREFREESGTEEEEVTIRSLEEIALEKDITWLNNKKYFIVNDEKTAELIFQYLDNYKYSISYDTETTGLRINMFGKVGSQTKKEMDEYNEKMISEGKKPIRIDRLVGIIFCVEENISYYFPCFNRKFKNLYSDTNEEVTKRTIEIIKMQYTMGIYRDRHDDMANYIRNTSPENWGSDVILMERCRHILETGNISAHHGSFEWKVGWLYNIDTNLVDDTMLLHQILYKFRSTTSNAGEPSKLKYLSKVEFGIDQLDLKDFFVGYVEEKEGEDVRERRNGKKGNKKKKKELRIDFSYMDYISAKCYAPADGDLALGLLHKYKRDLIENHSELEYIYNVEVIVACAIGYMEFYGHRLDEAQIESVKEEYILKKLDIEEQIREKAGYSNDLERAIMSEVNASYNSSKEKWNEYISYNKEINKITDIESKEYKRVKSKMEEVKVELDKRREKFNVDCSRMEEAIDNSENKLNLASPAQVADLFFNKMGIPFKGEKISVNKKVLKAYTKMKDENKNPKYPVINLYSEWKNYDTLLTKFFDNLQYFMYPGGYIFSSYGQIATATGRMSCKKPNAQQYPKSITGIVIPRPGYVHLDADFSQIEYRTLVAMAPEQNLIEAFKDPDMDYHTKMASLMYSVPYALVDSKMRGDAKSFNFGIPYGMGFKSLAILLTGNSEPSSVEEAKEKYELYFKDQPNVRMFFEKVKEGAMINKYTKTRWGRRRYYCFVDKDGNFSNARQAMALRQAGNAVIQGTAADIFKISVARNFTYIRRNGLLGLLLIINMIHDEQLMEVNVEKLNAQRVLRDVVENMEMKLDGFPPLYVGAGVSDSWAHAKGKMAEIHPVLAEQLSREADNLSVWSDYPVSADEVIEYFNKRVFEFRRQKIANYVLDRNNYGNVIDPVIGNLLGLQFDYGVQKEFEKYCEENNLGKEETAKVMSGTTLEQLRRFIEDNKLGVDYKLFTSVQSMKEEAEDVEYEDNEEDEVEEDEFNFYDGEFALVDEDMSLYGVALQDLIKQFGLVISKEKKVCGIDVSIMPYRKKDEMAEYFEQHACKYDDDGAMQVVFLMDGNIILNTDVWVNNIEGSSMNTKLGLNAILYR